MYVPKATESSRANKTGLAHKGHPQCLSLFLQPHRKDGLALWTEHLCPFSPWPLLCEAQQPNNDRLAPYEMKI